MQSELNLRTRFAIQLSETDAILHSNAPTEVAFRRPARPVQGGRVYSSAASRQERFFRIFSRFRGAPQTHPTTRTYFLLPPLRAGRFGPPRGSGVMPKTCGCRKRKSFFFVSAAWPDEQEPVSVPPLPGLVGVRNGRAVPATPSGRAFPSLV